MIVDILLISIALIALIIGSITDLKTREVPDWLNYSIIIIAIAIRLIYSIVTKEFNFVLYGLIGLAAYFVIANLMYYGKQWGGGDAKLFMALGALLATYPNTLLTIFSPKLDFPFLLIFFVNLLIIGSIYGLTYSLVLMIKHWNKFFKEAKKMFLSDKKIIYLTFSLAVIIFVLSRFITNELDVLMVALGILVILYPYLFIFVKSVEKASMIKKINVKKLTEGDWIIEEKIMKRFKISRYGVEKSQINKIIKARIKTVTIKEGLPFVPSFLIATIISLIFGNIIAFLI